MRMLWTTSLIAEAILCSKNQEISVQMTYDFFSSRLLSLYMIANISLSWMHYVQWNHASSISDTSKVALEDSSQDWHILLLEERPAYSFAVWEMLTQKFDYCILLSHPVGCRFKTLVNITTNPMKIFRGLLRLRGWSNNVTVRGLSCSLWIMNLR